MRALAVPAGRRPRIPPALRLRNFRLFWSGQLVSLVGTWMQSVAQAWLVLQLTNDPFWLGLVAAAQFAPVLVFGLFGGIIADALPKQRTLLATQLASMLLAFALAALTASGVVELWHILVLAILLGCTNAVDMPTRQAFVMEMAGRENIANAIGLNSAAFNAARIVGPAVAGLLIGVFGIAIAFAINGLSFVAVLASLLAMREEDLLARPVLARPDSVRAVVANLAEGLGYVRRTPAVLLAVAVVALVATAAMNFNVIVPAMARDVLGAGATGYGFLMAASGVGSLVSALRAAFVRRTSPFALVGGALLLGVAEAAVGLSRSFPLSLGLMFAVGLGAIAMTATANTLIQLAVPDALRGRVLSVYTTLFAGSTPIGGLVMGALASGFGPDVALVVGGLVAAGVGLVGLSVARTLPVERERVARAEEAGRPAAMR